MSVTTPSTPVPRGFSFFSSLSFPLPPSFLQGSPIFGSFHKNPPTLTQLLPTQPSSSLYRLSPLINTFPLSNIPFPSLPA